jgi:uncharacterized protein (TIGR02147 family)
MARGHKHVLKSCGQKVKPSSFLEPAKFLQACYDFMKAELDSYSFLDFAEDLGFSKTNVVHLMVRGKRRLSVKGAKRVCEALGITGTGRQYLETLAAHHNARLPEERQQLFDKLLSIKSRDLTNPIEQHQLDYYSSWYHPVIRELVGIRAIKRNDVSFVDDIHPRVLPEQARKSLELLETLGLIRYDETADKYLQTHANITTGDEIQSLAVVSYLAEVIGMGRAALTSIKAARRDISAVTVAVDEKTAKQIKAEIQHFRKRILALADECQSADGIYQINFQLFPFTK